MSDPKPGEGANERAVQFTYCNHDEKVSIRIVIPQRWWFGELPQYYQGHHWFLRAYCLDRKAWRDFAQTRIEGWIDRPLPPGHVI